MLMVARRDPRGVLGTGSVWSGAGFQLAGVVLFAVALPFCLSAIVLSDFTLRAPTPLTLAVAGIASFVGAILFRSIGRYPGIASSSYVFPCILPSYALAALYLLLARQEYSRLIFVSSGIFSLIWFYAVFFMQQRVRQMRIALVPFGSVSGLEAIAGVSWHVIQSPAPAGAPADFWPDAVAADLRADIPDEWDRALADFVLAGIPVYDVKQLLESLTGRVEIKHLSENSFGSLAPLPPYLRLRSIVDKILALAMIICLAPFLIVVAVLIHLDSPGPALFRQERVGYRGRVFEVIKFRTMRLADDVNPTSQIETAITKPGDHRITRLGHFLRRSRIDELPQIINILRGEMSWIGPRPEAVVLSRWYEQEIPFYRYRHIVPPGITGWAQVRLGHVAEINEVQEKLHYDFYYIKHFSLWLDFLITLKTLKTMLTGFGAR